MKTQDFIKLLQTSEEQIDYHTSLLEQHMKGFEIHKRVLDNPISGPEIVSCDILVNIYYDIGPELCVVVMLGTNRPNIASAVRSV